MSKRKFTWDRWNFDLEGDAYVVSKDECPNADDFVLYIAKNDFHWDSAENLNEVANIFDGWCCYQCRSDWDNDYGGGGYVVEIGTEKPKHGRGWFPVWIARSDDVCGD